MAIILSSALAHRSRIEAAISIIISAGKIFTMGAVRMTEDRIQLIARALADPRRLELLRRIGQSSDTARCSDLLCSAGVTAATLSHHMKELEIAGLVEAEREGRTVTYRLRRNVLEQYLANLAKI